MNFKSIIYYLGLLCFPLSALSFLNILYSSYFDYFLNVDSYILTLFLSFFTGLIFLFIGRRSNKRIDFFDQIILIFFTYTLISIFISIPYYLSNYQITLINALFESFSGITGTGFSVFDNIKYLDPTLIIWRSSSQWVGGIYFLIFLVLIFSNKQFNYKLNHLTYNSDGSVNSESNIKQIIFKISLIYLILSFLIFISLSFSNVRLFNALNLTMTLISNGGFLPTNFLNQIIKTNTQEFVLCITLIFSMLNFFFIFNLFNKRKITREHNEDFALIIISIIFTLILVLLINDLGIFKALISVVSSISNSGLTLYEPQKNISLYFLLITIIGGSIISNSSGIKFMRIYILVKTTKSEILKLVRPNNIFNQNILNSDIKNSNENIKNSFLIFISFFISFLILSSVLLLDNISFEDSFKLSILTLTNTVNSSLYNLSDINFSNLITSSKISIIFFMLIGKLELVSLYIILYKIFFKN